MQILQDTRVILQEYCYEVAGILNVRGVNIAQYSCNITQVSCNIVQYLRRGHLRFLQRHSNITAMLTEILQYYIAIFLCDIAEILLYGTLSSYNRIARNVSAMSQE